MKKNKLLISLFALLNIFGIQLTKLQAQTFSPFVLNPATDIIIGSAGITLAATDFAMDKIFKINKIQYDESMTFDKQDVNSFDRFLMNDYSKNLDYLSYATQFASLAVPLIMLKAPSDQWLTIGVMYAESALLAYGLKELAKNLVNRPRPYMYFDNPPQKKILNGDWTCSFFSGHTTASFMSAAFTTFVYTTYFPVSKWTIPVIIGSYTLAGMTATLRIFSGNHFLTDVLAGAVTGTLCGILIPLLHTLSVPNPAALQNPVLKNAAANSHGFGIPIGINFTF